MGKQLVVVVESREYAAFADDIFARLKNDMVAHNVVLSRVTVPQFFDLPTALRMIIEATQKTAREHWKTPDGFIISGAAIESDVTTFTLRSLQEITSYFCIATGLGTYVADSLQDLQVMETEAINYVAKNAVESCVSLMKLKGQLNLNPST